MANQRVSPGGLASPEASVFAAHFPANIIRRSHPIRDLNAGLLENPFDEEFKHFAFEFGRLLRSIVTTIDGHGLRRSHLAKHRREVDHFGSSVFKCGTAGFSRSNGSFRPLFALKNGRTIIFTGM